MVSRRKKLFSISLSLFQLDFTKSNSKSLRGSWASWLRSQYKTLSEMESSALVLCEKLHINICHVISIEKVFAHYFKCMTEKAVMLSLNVII